MKQISPLEIKMLQELITTAREELDAAQDDGWVVTTDVEDQFTSCERLLGAISTSKDIEVE